MGMYSHVDYSDVQIVDAVGVMNWLENAKKMIENIIPKEYEGRYERSREEVVNEYMFWVGVLRETWKDGVTADVFESLMDEAKIIQYWYQGFSFFLRDLALYVEGRIILNFETGEEKAVITFEDGEASISNGEMNWSSDEDVTAYSELPELSAQEKLRRKVIAIDRGGV